MKAILCHSYGPIENLTYGAIADPVAGPQEVVIEVHAAGVNFPDVLLVQGLYQSQPQFPFSPGAEVAGVVAEVGEGVSQFEKGDRVAAYLHYGGFAEKVKVPVKQCTHIPVQLSFEVASSFLVTYGTAFHALKDRAKIKPGERLAVLGAAGGVGLAAVELGHKLGADVTACASSDQKLELTRNYGANATVNYRNEDLGAALKKVGGPQGIDVVLDPVGGDLTEKAFRSLGYNGRYLVVGFTAGKIPKIALNLPLLKIASLVGVFWGRWMRMFPEEAAINHHQLVKWIAAGELKPMIQRTYPLKEAVDAMLWLQERKAMGKVVIQVYNP